MRNWSTVSKTLQRLGDANLVARHNVRVGKHASRATMWRLEPEFGSKVAQSLELIERWMDEAAFKRQTSSPSGKDSED